jgi:hypothetical protein
VNPHKAGEVVIIITIITTTTLPSDHDLTPSPLPHEPKYPPSQVGARHQQQPWGSHKAREVVIIITTSITILSSLSPTIHHHIVLPPPFLLPCHHPHPHSP